MKKKNRSVFLNVLKIMPPLYHKHPEVDVEEWDINDSELLKWAIQNDELKIFFTNQLKNSKYIRYDQETGCWIGIDYEKTKGGNNRE